MSDDESTRPISVAELLARNGTIGAPPVGGHRRRRRGNSNAVSVAELTGEIPIIRTGEIPVVTAEQLSEPSNEAPEVEAPSVEAPEVEAPEVSEVEAPTEEPVETVDEVVDEVIDEVVAESVPEPVEVIDEVAEPVEVIAEPIPEPVAEISAPIEEFAEAVEEVPEPEPVPEPEEAPEPDVRAASDVAAESDAEQMAPDPVDESAVLIKIAGGETTVETDDEIPAELQSYLRSSGGTLFSGGTVADDLARRGVSDSDEDRGAATEGNAAAADVAPGKLAAFGRASLAVLQSVLAVVFGAGLFLAFDQLWRWNNIVALVLSVLVILGLVVAVRVVRKTEDIVSTLIAVAVGALVTLGPLALLQST